MTRSSSADAATADTPAEAETLRDLMRQPAMAVGMGLVAVGCVGLLLAIVWLWWIPPSSRIAPSVAEAPAARSQEKPRPPASASGSLAQDLVMPKAGGPVAAPPATLPEMPPTPAETDAATPGGVVATAAPVPEPAPPSAPPSAVAATPEIAAPAPPPVTMATVAPPPAAVAVPTPPPAAVAAPTPPPAAIVAPAPPPAAAAQSLAPAAVAKGYRVQLGAMRTPEGAQQVWDQLQHQHSDVLGKLAYAAPRVDLGSRGVFYRIQAGPLPDAAAANRACAELKHRGVSCILVRP